MISRLGELQRWCLRNEMCDTHSNQVRMYVIMNLWDYFEREAQKYERIVNITAKVFKATGK